MREILAGWSADLEPAWTAVLADVDLDFDAIGRDLELEPWEPVFPARRGKRFPGAPAGAHMLRAFDGIAPDAVRCVVLGQDPYPEPGFATGRAFEAGNVAAWRELDKMFSKSVRAFLQLVVAARSGDSRYADSFAAWHTTLTAVESGLVELEPPDALAQRWVGQGVLLLNTSLTLSRFAVAVDPHQARGHLPLWRPLMQRVIAYLRDRGTPVVFLGFGDAAAATLRAAGLGEDAAAPCACVLRAHPAFAEQVLGRDNPFEICNRRLEAMGAAPIAW
ncbi:MAG: uracil-DNA glycosylase [Alphaproteobacteria bacterium]